MDGQEAPGGVLAEVDVQLLVLGAELEAKVGDQIGLTPSSRALFVQGEEALFERDAVQLVHEIAEAAAGGFVHGWCCHERIV